MFKKSNSFLWIVSVTIMLSLISMLTPISDCDNDGYLDSPVTEGMLLFLLITTAIEPPVRQNRLPALYLANPKVPPTTLFHPPTLFNPI